MQIVLAFGANLETPFGTPQDTLLAAVAALNARNDISFDQVSSVYCSPPVGPSYQPQYYNLVASGQTKLSPVHLLAALQGLEKAFGRRGGLCWGPRPLDVDIIDYDQKIRTWGHAMNTGLARKFAPLTLPHPRAHQRPFVLVPLQEIMPKWRHPILRLSPSALLSGYCLQSDVRAVEKLEIA